MIALSLRRAVLLSAAILLSGCNTVLMNPSGYIAKQQGNLIVISTVLMLLIIVPVIALTFLFAWRYRKNNTSAIYEPDWDHSTKLELLIWGAPLLIIIVLGTITWISTHKLDPYRPLTHIEADRPFAAGAKPLIVEVVAIDWKWLFIYPELGIASVNELAAPVDVQIKFKITSSSVMNSFYIPALAGQIYAMPGMQTSLHAVINKPGEFEGFSANYSGAGFSDMRFKFHGMSDENFKRWVEETRAKGTTLDRAVYTQLEQPSERNPVQYFGTVDSTLFHAIVNRCLLAGQTCMDQMMSHDAHKSAAHAPESARASNSPAQAPIQPVQALTPPVEAPPSPAHAPDMPAHVPNIQAKASDTHVHQ
jgi:cytochrome o ubiquinol oxidase subunit 2